MVFLFWGGNEKKKRKRRNLKFGDWKAFLMLENLYYSKGVLNLFELYPFLSFLKNTK